MSNGAKKSKDEIVSAIPDVREPVPTFTDRELRCIAHLIASYAWIPNEWVVEIGSIAKKIRLYFGDES